MSCYISCWSVKNGICTVVLRAWVQFIYTDMYITFGNTLTIRGAFGLVGIEEFEFAFTLNIRLVLWCRIVCYNKETDDFILIHSVHGNIRLCTLTFWKYEVLDEALYYAC